MKEREVEYPATCVAHWATGPVNTCDEHAKQLVALGRIMGCHVAVTQLEEPAECTNCANGEAVKAHAVHS